MPNKIISRVCGQDKSTCGVKIDPEAKPQINPQLHPGRVLSRRRRLFSYTRIFDMRIFDPRIFFTRIHRDNTRPHNFLFSNQRLGWLLNFLIRVQ